MLSCVTKSNFFAAIISEGTIQLPPTHKTFFRAKYSLALLALTPPVGQKTTSPKGGALWAKLDKPDREYNAKGQYSVDLVADPGDVKVKAFIETLEELRELLLDSAGETLHINAENKMVAVAVGELEAMEEPIENMQVGKVTIERQAQ